MATTLRTGYTGHMPLPSEPPERLTLPPANEGWKHTMWVILGALMFGAMLVAAAVWTAPALVSDWQIHNAAQPVADGRVSEGKCNSRLVFHICDVTLSVATNAGRVSRDVNYVFTGFHFGDYSVTVLADPARPELATTDMALDKLWNRTITLLAVSAVLLALTVAPVVALFRRWRGTSGGSVGRSAAGA